MPITMMIAVCSDSRLFRLLLLAAIITGLLDIITILNLTNDCGKDAFSAAFKLTSKLLIVVVILGNPPFSSAFILSLRFTLINA